MNFLQHTTHFSQSLCLIFIKNFLIVTDLEAFVIVSPLHQITQGLTIVVTLIDEGKPPSDQSSPQIRYNQKNFHEARNFFENVL